MKLSRLFFRTFKEAPQEADVISHQLLERGGYLRKVSKGIYIYTPLMWRVLKKLIQIVREELDKAGAQEISMPLLHPRELWQTTGRWDDFTAENLLFTLRDREENQFCLGPTHEEVVVFLVSNWITSYKQLPLNLYQIGTKFRDEIRPRFGLMRAKEFLMKDGYSFSSTPAGMEEQYEAMRQAYSAIFKRLGLQFAIVEAHGGKIGKGKSEEFQVLADIGEDVIMVCGDYAANIEATQSVPPQFKYDQDKKEVEEIKTPKISTIDDLTALTGMPKHQIVKTLIFKLIYPKKEDFVAIGIRGDREINPVKVATRFGAMEIALATDEEIQQQTGCRVGFAGPMHCSIPFFADFTCQPMTNFFCAGNREDIHYKNLNWQRDCPLPEFDDFLLAEEGDGCPHVPGGVYHRKRGIEVGHIFNLGTRYSEKLGALFQDEDGKMFPFWMGTYGIGIGRVAAACIEQSHDEKGIIWPFAIAPFQIVVTPANQQDPEQSRAAEEVYDLLQANGYEPLLDDRDERLGFKLKDSDLIGLPYKLIIGRAFKEEEKIEIESRRGEKTLIAKKDLVHWAKENLFPVCNELITH